MVSASRKTGQAFCLAAFVLINSREPSSTSMPGHPIQRKSVLEGSCLAHSKYAVSPETRPPGLAWKTSLLSRLLTVKGSLLDTTKSVMLISSSEFFLGESNYPLRLLVTHP